MKRRGRSGIEKVVLAFVVIAILFAVVIALAVSTYQGYANGPKAAVLLGVSAGDCGSVSFHIQNQDTRILHGWYVVPSISPSDSHIQTSPGNFTIEPLAPKGNSSQYTFNITFTGAPTGVYQLRLELLNGSSTIATSDSLSCTVQ
jgi:hypothetical protein